MYFCCKQNKNVIVNRNIILTIKLNTKQMELLGIIGPFQILIFLTIIFFTAVLPILAIIDILRSEFAGNNKIMWVLIVLFTVSYTHLRAHETRHDLVCRL